MSDWPQIRIAPNSPKDAERAALLQRHYNWLYETNAEFRARVDAIPTSEELLWSIALYGVYPPPEDPGNQEGT